MSATAPNPLLSEPRRFPISGKRWLAPLFVVGRVGPGGQRTFEQPPPLRNAMLSLLLVLVITGEARADGFIWHTRDIGIICVLPSVLIIVAALVGIWHYRRRTVGQLQRPPESAPKSLAASFDPPALLGSVAVFAGLALFAGVILIANSSGGKFYPDSSNFDEIETPLNCCIFPLAIVALMLGAVYLISRKGSAASGGTSIDGTADRGPDAHSPVAKQTQEIAPVDVTKRPDRSSEVPLVFGILQWTAAAILGGSIGLGLGILWFEVVDGGGYTVLLDAPLGAFIGAVLGVVILRFWQRRS